METSSHGSRRGFTLIELLVGIAIIAILAALLLPTLARSKQQAQGVKCLSNSHQLCVGWLMYASDNREILANNIPAAGSPPGFGGWCNGVLSEAAGNPDNTNYMYMMGAAGDGNLMTTLTIGPYCKSPGVYQCPADPIMAKPYSVPRCRSYSMNFCLGSKSAAQATDSTYNDVWPNFFKSTDLKRSSLTWVFNDEHPDSINDGVEFTATGDGEDNQWSDIPASYHNNACGFAFADGHSEIHKWMQASTSHPVTGQANWLPWAAQPPYTDILYVESRLSPAETGQPWQVPH